MRSEDFFVLHEKLLSTAGFGARRYRVAALSCSAPSRVPRLGRSASIAWRRKRTTSSGDAQDCSRDPRGRIDG
jgi:hypothetical protein